jgi:hypothetical protein
MSQPVKLSDALVLDARIVGKAQERSIAGQVEFWAKLGRSVEMLLEGRQVLALSRGMGATSLAEAINLAGTPRGRRQLGNYLESTPYPHYQAHAEMPGVLVRTEENGTKTIGRFVNREFVAEGRISPKREVEPPYRRARKSRARG